MGSQRVKTAHEALSDQITAQHARDQVEKADAEAEALKAARAALKKGS